MRKVQLGETGEYVPVIGQGMWNINLGENHESYVQWIKSIKTGIELGLTHIETSEKYGEGSAEKALGRAITDFKRDELFITGKLLSWKFRRSKMIGMVKKSLKRLGITHFDLYIVQKANLFVTIKKYMKFLEELVNLGLTRYIGVSNFSPYKFEQAQHYLKREELVNNQFNASIVEPHHLHSMLPFFKKFNTTITLYDPSRHRDIIHSDPYYLKDINKVAQNHNLSKQQTSIAWLLNQENVITLVDPINLGDLGSRPEESDVPLEQEEISLFYEEEDLIEFEQYIW